VLKKKSLPKSHYHVLREKWLKRHRRVKRQFKKKHKQALELVSEIIPEKEKLASSAAGLLMLSSTLPATTSAVEKLIDQDKPLEQVEIVDNTKALISELTSLNFEKVRVLTVEEETKISQTLSKYFKMDIKAEIDGKRLNRTLGVIGAEQHLTRYPGDNMVTHLSEQEAKNKFIYSSGMAPGRGAWGYFANSRSEFGQKAVDRERWYIAVQTFLAPEYNLRLSDYRDFFKYRKMLVVNPRTGQAIVCDIADAGPAVWTGKHLGGSPEVMHHLGFSEGMRKGPVLYFFIDDPDDRIPLGPIDI